MTITIAEQNKNDLLMFLNRKTTMIQTFPLIVYINCFSYRHYKQIGHISSRDLRTE